MCVTDFCTIFNIKSDCYLDNALSNLVAMGHFGPHNTHSYEQFIPVFNVKYSENNDNLKCNKLNNLLVYGMSIVE